MPYFIIIPLYLILLVVLISAMVMLRFFPKLQFLKGYLLGGTIGSFPGLLLANVLLWLLIMLPVYGAEHCTLPEWAGQTVKIIVAAALLIGPFVASAAGGFFGAALGIYIVYRKR